MNKLIFGFYILHVEFNGTVRVLSAVGKSFVGFSDCSGARYNTFKSVDEALKIVREWSLYTWEHNDQKTLIEEYQLTPSFVRDFLRRTWPVEPLAHYSHEKDRLEKQIQFNKKAGLI